LFIFFRLTTNADSSEPIAKPAEFPDELWKIVEMMIEVDPQKRKSAEEVGLKKY
jgi:hypothetical protein